MTLFASHPTDPRSLHTIRVRGELDISSAGRCRDVLRAAVLAVASEAVQVGHPEIHAAGSVRPRVVCDLEGVEFLSAAGVGALVETDQYARRQGVEFVLFAAPRPVRRVLALTGLDRQLLVLSTSDVAEAGAEADAVRAS